jgi:hypothetical protein
VPLKKQIHKNKKDDFLSLFLCLII